MITKTVKKKQRKAIKALRDAESPPNESFHNLTSEETQAKITSQLDAAYKLDNVDRAVISLMMQYPGITTSELAKSMGYSREWMSTRLNRPGFKAAMTEIRKSVMDLLVDAQTAAIRRLKKETQNPDAELAIAASKALLMPLARAENVSASIQQHLVYAVKFGEGGQLYKEIRPMKQEEFFLDVESPNDVTKQ